MLCLVHMLLNIFTCILITALFAILNVIPLLSRVLITFSVIILLDNSLTAKHNYSLESLKICLNTKYNIRARLRIIGMQRDLRNLWPAKTVENTNNRLQFNHVTKNPF